MLQVYHDKVPDIDGLEEKIMTCLAKPECALHDLNDVIYKHIAYDSDEDIDESEVMSTVFSVIDTVIEELKVTNVNCHRIREYTQVVHSFAAYERLLTDFSDLITPDDRVALLARGKEIFVTELTEHWE